MTGDDSQDPHDKPGFDDIFDDLDEQSAFDWDDEQLEADEVEQTRPVVSFRIGADLFAIAGDSVREIMGGVEATALPGAPGHIQGVTVVRRQIVGLLSLRQFLGLQPPSAPLENPAPDVDTSADGADSDDELSTERTLIVETAHYTAGLRVDEVTGLAEWPESALDPETLPGNLHDTTRRYARGARQHDESLCVYLDLETLLDDAAVQ